MAGGVLPLGDEPLYEDCLDVAEMLAMAGKIPAASQWVPDLIRRAGLATLGAMD